MIEWLLLYKRPWAWIFAHVLLGLLSTITPFILIFFFYAFVFTSFQILKANQKSKILLTLLIVYLVPFEMICRMAQTSPYIPYELSKYLQFILLLFGIFTWRSLGRIGVFMLFLLLPALFYDFSNKVDFKGWVFNILAPINLCLGIIYFYKRPLTIEQFKLVIIAVVLPLISALIFTYIKTPDYDEIEFQLGANFDTTGGFGSNQVSTVFGLGMFLMFYLWYNSVKFSGYRLVDGIILILFVLQGLLSFSRGGMIGGALAILIFLFFEMRQNRFQKSRKSSKIIKYLLPGIFLILSTIWIANDITDGLLLLRYQGETNSTLAGKADKDLNSITSNRANIFEGDLDIFFENNLGVGVGASQYMRNVENGVASHVELSRLLAEHGFLGLLFFLLLTVIPLYHFGKRNTSNSSKGFLISLYFLAWYTTFHAATRNFVTPLLIGIALVSVVKSRGSESATLLSKDKI
jgi:hypothetical protein